MSHWLYLPLDGRPCNARFPLELAGLIGQQLRSPEPELLGDAKVPARRDRLHAWAERHLEQAQGFCLSLDTWIYGNLVASRKNTQSFAQLQSQLDLLASFKRQHPQLGLHGFATLLRLSNSNDETEERPYWKQHGQQIYRLSWLEHYLQLHQDEASSQELAELTEQIPAEILTDYRSLRQRNLSLLESLLNQVEQGLLETLLIGCDDGGSYGWTVLERQHLQQQIKQRGLEQQVLLYPGADELASVLLARVLIPERPCISLAWSYPEAAGQITRYEGLPLNETLANQARAAGLELSETAEAEGLLWLHNPPAEQIDQYLDRQSRVSFEPQRLEPLLEALQASKPVALADLCYANGGDIKLLEQLEARQALFRLAGYAAWNTSGNTLGMLLAWFKLSLSRPLDTRAQRRFLLERLLDDGWYQGHLRQQLCEHYTQPVTLNSCIQAIAYFNDKLRSWQDWMPNPPDCLQINHLSFPWKRFFEVDLRVCDKALEPLSGQKA